VQAGDMDTDGITLGTVLTGTIRNAAGKDADLTLHNVGNTTGVLVNTTNPGVVISTTATSPVIAPFTATITFTEAVTGFTVGDITVTNATLSGFQTTDNITYTVLVTPSANGAVTLQVPASVAVNIGNNANVATEPRSVGIRVSTEQRNKELLSSLCSTSSVQITSIVAGITCMTYTRVFVECMTT